MPPSRVARSIVLVAVLGVTGAGCGTGPADPADEVGQRYAHWRAARPASYSYELRRDCVCPPSLVRPTWLRVEGESVVEARDLEDDTPVPASDPRALTIDDIFQALLDHLKKPGASVRMDFATDFGYPTLIHGWLSDVLDTDFSFRVEAFHAGP